MGIQERKQRERERRRQQIMVAAKKVFTAKGFNKTTMEDIAKEAELSPGTLYLYFKNKDELYASLSLRILQYLLIRLEHVTGDNRLNPESRIRTLKDVLLDLYRFDPLILLNMFHIQSGETLKNLSPELLSEIQHLSNQALGNIGDLFRQQIFQRRFASENEQAGVHAVERPTQRRNHHHEPVVACHAIEYAGPSRILDHGSVTACRCLMMES